MKKVINFLKSIGISCKMQEGVSGFTDGIRIHGGGLLIDPKCPVSSILHEAGHLAVLPSKYRKYACDNLEKVMRKMSNEIDFTNLDEGDARSCMQSEDTEATAWAWAVGKYLNIQENKIIRDEDYQNGGEELRGCLNAISYFGIQGLAAAGFCTGSRIYAMCKPAPLYPKLAFWLQK